MRLMLFMASLGLFLFGIYLSKFAQSIYKDIPSGLGGGRPDVVRIVASDDSKRHLEKSGVQFPSSDNVTEPTEMLLATGSEYVLRAKSTGQTVVAPADAVKALIFEKH
jgi:hypothetical protein